MADSPDKVQGRVPSQYALNRCTRSLKPLQHHHQADEIEMLIKVADHTHVQSQRHKKGLSVDNITTQHHAIKLRHAPCTQVLPPRQ